MTKEQKFYIVLQDVFIGAKIEGVLKKDIKTHFKIYPKFRDELLDKLYSFFSRYFTKIGSIYFNSTPFHNNIYENVYTD